MNYNIKYNMYLKVMDWLSYLCFQEKEMQEYT